MPISTELEGTKAWSYVDANLLSYPTTLHTMLQTTVEFRLPLD